MSLSIKDYSRSFCFQFLKHDCHSGYRKSCSHPQIHFFICELPPQVKNIRVVSHCLLYGLEQSIFSPGLSVNQNRKAQAIFLFNLLCREKRQSHPFPKVKSCENECNKLSWNLNSAHRSIHLIGQQINKPVFFQTLFLVDTSF